MYISERAEPITGCAFELQLLTRQAVMLIAHACMHAGELGGDDDLDCTMMARPIQGSMGMQPLHV